MIHKYTAFCLAFSFVFLTQNVVFGQIHKGSWLIGGSGSLYAAKDKSEASSNPIFETKNRGIYFNADVGYFFTDRIAFGGQLAASFGYDYINTFDTNTQEGRQQTSNGQYVGLKPYGRYYFTPNQKLKCYGELALNTGFSNYKRVNKLINVPGDIADIDFKIFQLNVIGSIGADYFITPNIALEGSLFYAFYYYTRDNSALISYDESTAFPKFYVNSEFKMRFFLNAEKKNTAVLAEQYLKKNNWTFGLNGFLNNYNSTKLALTPFVGYFVSNRFLVQTGFVFYGHKWNDDTDVRLVFGIEPKLKYFHPLSKNLQIVGKIGTSGYLRREFKQIITDQKLGSTINGGIGLNKFIADNLSIEGTFNFDYNMSTKKFNFNPNIQFGLAYFMDKRLGKKKA